ADDAPHRRVPHTDECHVQTNTCTGGQGLRWMEPLVRGQAFGATLLRPLMMRSIASPPVGSVRLARSLRVNFIRSGWVRPRWAAIFMTFGLPISFTKARPRV